MNPAELSGKARRHLRALGHHLKPVVQLGKEGVTPALVAALEVAIVDHELVKVRLGDNAEGDRHALSDSLAAATKTHLVGLIGRTLLLYRRNSEKAKIELPKSKKKAS